MIKIIMSGIGGAMGRTIASLIDKEENVEIVAGIDVKENLEYSFPVFKSLEECNIMGDCVIDFSTYKATDKLLEDCINKRTPLVLCTTGLSNEQIKKVEEASKKIPILKSFNMSLGINLLCEALEEVSKKLIDSGFDCEIIEKHHRLKKDSPSGTALMLGESVKEGYKKNLDFVFDRSSRETTRPKDEIGFSALRGGTIPGDHDVVFCGVDEVITFSHRSYSKAVFGKGAISASKFLIGKNPGLYNMRDVIK